MEQEILDEIKNNYNESLERKKYISGLIDKINKLEENDIVKKYIELMIEYESLKDDKIISQSDQSIFDSICRSYICEIKETNGIYVCLGTFMSDDSVDIVHSSADIRVSRDDPRAEYRIYRNIEDGNTKYISIKNCEMFEKTHDIIILNTNIFTDIYYYKLQKEFFSLAVTFGQEEAKRKILEKK